MNDVYIETYKKYADMIITDIENACDMILEKI